MDQDLSLMEQLLTLNETIEELKWQKKYYHSQSSVPNSSCDLSASDLSISYTDMDEYENEAPEKFSTSSPVSSRGLKRDLNTGSDDVVSDRLEQSQTDLFDRPTIDTTILTEEFQRLLAGNCCQEEQNSFDSGIHEPTIRKQILV